MDQMKITIALQMWGQFMAGPPDTGGDRSTHGFHSPAFALFIYWILQQMIFERCIALRGDGIWISTSSRFLYNRILAPHEPSIEVRNVQGYKVTIVNKSLPPDRARKASTFILAEKQQYASDL